MWQGVTADGQVALQRLELPNLAAIQTITHSFHSSSNTMVNIFDPAGVYTAVSVLGLLSIPVLLAFIVCYGMPYLSTLMIIPVIGVPAVILADWSVGWFITLQQMRGDWQVRHVTGKKQCNWPPIAFISSFVSSPPLS